MNLAISLILLTAIFACNKRETDTHPVCMHCEISELGIQIDTCVPANTIFVYQDSTGHTYQTKCDR